MGFLGIEGVRYIETFIIFSFDELKNLFIEKAQKGSYFLLYNEPNFTEIINPPEVVRETFTSIRESLLPMNIIKYINFRLKGKYSTKQIYYLLQILQQTIKILATFYNSNLKECTIFFIGNHNEYLLKQQIKDFLELEAL